MSETQAVMVSVDAGKYAKAYMAQIAKRFERLNDIPVRMIDEDDLRKFKFAHPHFSRYAMWKILPSTVDRVIYFDTDIVPMRPLPELPEEDFAAAPEAQWIYDQVSQHWPILAEAGHFFNSGVFVAKRSTEELFDTILDKQTSAGNGDLPWLRDQTMLNVEVQTAVKRGKLTYKRLSSEWNQLTQNATEFVENPCMLHFAGIQKTQYVKTGFVAQIVRRLDELEK